MADLVSRACARDYIPVRPAGRMVSTLSSTNGRQVGSRRHGKTAGGRRSTVGRTILRRATGGAHLRLAGHGLDLFQHFVVLRKTADVVLVPDLGAVHMDVKDAAAALDHLRVDAKLLLDRFRQTGGRRKVVSLHAVLDTDLHVSRSPRSY